MRYFTRKLYIEMQRSSGSQEFEKHWEDACQKDELDRQAAFPFMSDDMVYIVNRSWHDAYIDEIDTCGDKVCFLMKKDAADIHLSFYGVIKFVNSTEGKDIWWLYDEFRRLDDGCFEWNILMDSGEISICFQDLDVSIIRKPYIPQLLEEISLDNAFQEMRDNQDQILQMFQGDESKLSELKNRLASTYNREDILKRRIIQAIYGIAAFDHGECLTELEKNICAIQALVIVLNQMLSRYPVQWKRSSLTEAYGAGADIFSRLIALLKETDTTILQAFIHNITVDRPVEEADVSTYIERFSQDYEKTIEDLYGEMDEWLTQYIMAHMDELAG